MRRHHCREVALSFERRIPSTQYGRIRRAKDIHTCEGEHSRLIVHKLP
jgi:hypothetical protein